MWNPVKELKGQAVPRPARRPERVESGEGIERENAGGTRLLAPGRRGIR